jgi:hypothetical protein
MGTTFDHLEIIDTDETICFHEMNWQKPNRMGSKGNAKRRFRGLIMAPPLKLFCSREKGRNRVELEELGTEETS